MKCWKCGAELDDDAIFCTECGNQQRERQKEIQKEIPPKPQEEKKEKTGAWVLGIGVGILAFIVILFFFVKSDAKKVTEQKETQSFPETQESFPETEGEESETESGTESEIQNYSGVVPPEIETDESEEAWDISGEENQNIQGNVQKETESESEYVPETQPEAVITFAGVIDKAEQQAMLFEGNLLDSSYMSMLMENTDADYAGYVVDIANMEEYSIGDADTAMPASALIGVPILFAIADSVDRGEISMDTPVTLEYTFVNGRGIFKQSDNGKTFSVYQMLSEALKNSDNNALNSLISFLKLKNINNICHSYGYDSVKMERKLISKNTKKENYISPRDAALMLNAIYQDNFQSIGKEFLKENFRISAADTSNVGMYPACSSSDTFLNLNGITKSRYNEVGLVEDGDEVFILSVFTCEGDGEKSAVAVQSLATYVKRTLEKE